MTLCSIAFAASVPIKIIVLDNWAWLLIPTAVTDDRLTTEEVQHRLIWPPQQDCADSGCLSSYSWSICGLLHEWALSPGLSVLIWSNRESIPPLNMAFLPFSTPVPSRKHSSLNVSVSFSACRLFSFFCFPVLSSYFSPSSRSSSSSSHARWRSSATWANTCASGASPPCPSKFWATWRRCACWCWDGCCSTPSSPPKT